MSNTAASARPRRKQQARRRQVASSKAQEQPDFAVFPHGDELDTPAGEELRRVRADFYSKAPEDRRKDSVRKMAYSGISKNQSPQKKKPIKATATVTSGTHIEHRRRHRKPREVEDIGGTAGAYREGDLEKDRRTTRISHASSTSRNGRRVTQKSDQIRILGISSFATSDRGSRAVKKRKLSNSQSERRQLDTSIHPQKEKRSVKVVLDQPTFTDSARLHVSRSASMREKPSKTTARPNLVRSQTTSRQVRSVSESCPPTSAVRDRAESITSAKKAERPSGFLSSIFGLRKVSEAEEEEQIECLTCSSDDIPITKSAKLACGHHMCHSCLRRVFTMSVTDPAHMPPKCCTAAHIPLKHVDNLFDLRFKVKWNKKYQEYTTKNRIYCPAKGCGEWIKPANIHVDTSGGANGGRKYGKCGRCKTKVCATCNGKWHTSRECPKDEATARFAEIAKEAGWQRCFNCSATVELKEGCNHMTCRCRAEFCMICGAKWKSCDCPWFNYEAVENDRLNHMNIPQAIREAIEGMNMPRAYHEEIERRQEQERRDEALARRMQVLGLDNSDDNDDNDDDNDDGVFAVGNAAGHFMNQDFVNRAAHILTAAYGNGQAEAADRMVREANAARPEQRMQWASPPLPPPPPANPSLGRPARPPLLRQHSTASRRYNNQAHTRASERVVPRRIATNYASEAAAHRPPGGDTETGTGAAVPAARLPTNRRRHSAMAGLTRDSAEGRVDEWRRHVEEDETVPD